MVEKIEIKAVDLVRAIRDQQTQLLAGKSAEEIIAFFRSAAEAARGQAKPSASTVRAAS